MYTTTQFAKLIGVDHIRRKSKQQKKTLKK